MRPLVTGKQMKATDACTIQTIGIPSMVLMERAALAVAQALMSHVQEQTQVWFFCGVGNNGADGLAAARMLALEGVDTCCVICGDPQRGTAEFKSQLSVLRQLGLSIRSFSELRQDSALPGDLVAVDGLFGVGLNRSAEGIFRECMEWIQERRQDGRIRWLTAIDMPSGIDSDSGQIMGTALKVDETVTFGWEKLGTVLYPGREYAGQVRLCRAGFPEAALKQALAGENRCFACEEADLELIPGRKAWSNKGTFGRVLIVAGSENMCGAAYLSALAAYRTGAGLVRILTVEANRQILQQRLPEAILAVYSPQELTENREAFQERIQQQCQWADVIVLGPGLGSEAYVEYLVEDILTLSCSPVIIDADGLNAISLHPYLTAYYTENILITPHLGEMARLTGQSIPQIQQNLLQTASDYALRYGITCILKDAATVSAFRDGSLCINTSGCSALAKAGSGDVLTGVIAGLLALKLDEETSACLGVYVHGRAGELLAEEKGPHSLLASELADRIGAAMEPKTQGRRRQRE